MASNALIALLFYFFHRANNNRGCTGALANFAEITHTNTSALKRRLHKPLYSAQRDLHATADFFAKRC
jgi:hypothetical protein